MDRGFSSEEQLDATRPAERTRPPRPRQPADLEMEITSSSESLTLPGASRRASARPPLPPAPPKPNRASESATTESEFDFIRISPVERWLHHSKRASRAPRLGRRRTHRIPDDEIVRLLRLAIRITSFRRYRPTPATRELLDAIEIMLHDAKRRTDAQSGGGRPDSDDQ